MERNLTTTSSIPVGVAADGTIQSDTNNADILQRSTYTAWVSGGAYSTLELAVSNGQVWENKTGVNTTTLPENDSLNWKRYDSVRKRSTWIYIPNDGAGNQKIARVKSVCPRLDVTAETYTELIYMESDISTTGAVAFEWVEANLRSYYIDNNGVGAGVYNGVVFAQNEILNQEDRLTPAGHKYWEAVTVDGTGTNFFIIENT